MYKIYFNQITIYILTPQKASEKTQSVNSISLMDKDVTAFQELIEKYNFGGKISKIFILTSNPPKLFQYLFRETILIKAAGGLVLNENNQLLMIKRHGIWDLPKGKAERNEKLRDAAIREVEEECGISGLEIVEKLSPTYHVYIEKKKWYIKKSCWYKMFTKDTTMPVPQIKEHISEVVWLSEQEVAKKLKMAYGNIKDVVKKHYLNKKK